MMNTPISNEPEMPLPEAVAFLQGKIDEFPWGEPVNQFAGSDAPQGKAAGVEIPGYIKSPDSYLHKSGSFIFGEQVKLKEIENDGHKEMCHQGFSQDVGIHKGNPLAVSNTGGAL